MERRSFLSGLITAVGAGVVTLATPGEVAAFGVGDQAAITQLPVSEKPMIGFGEMVYMQSRGRMVPAGRIVDFQLTRKEMEVTRREDKNRVYEPGTASATAVVALSFPFDLDFGDGLGVMDINPVNPDPTNVR